MDPNNSVIKRLWCTSPLIVSSLVNTTLFLFQALNDAKRELRFLLVYLHGNDHQDTENFCR